MPTRSSESTTRRSSPSHNVTDDTCRLTVSPVPIVALFLHGIENTAVHWFQAVANIWKRTGNDHAHRIIEVGASHLLLDRNWVNTRMFGFKRIVGQKDIPLNRTRHFDGTNTGSKPPPLALGFKRRLTPKRVRLRPPIKHLKSSKRRLEAQHCADVIFAEIFQFLFI